MTPTPLTVTLPTQTMTVEALEALIVEAKAKAAPQPVPDAEYRSAGTTDEAVTRNGDVYRFHDGAWQFNLARGNGPREWIPSSGTAWYWQRQGLVPYVPPAPTPRYAVGDYAVYVMDPDRAGWGVVEILEVVQTGYRAKSMNPLYGIGTFAPSWLRPATENEIAAATAIDLKVGMLLKRKSDGAVLRVWNLGTDRRLEHLSAVGHCTESAENVSRLTYDILDSYTIQGVQ